MNHEDAAVSKSSPKDKNEIEKELPTLPADTAIEESTKSDKEKKVVVVKPGESDIKISDISDQSEQVKQEEGDNTNQ
jgi:hypothetical protein